MVEKAGSAFNLGTQRAWLCVSGDGCRVACCAEALERSGCGLLRGVFQGSFLQLLNGGQGFMGWPPMGVHQLFDQRVGSFCNRGIEVGNHLAVRAMPLAEAIGVAAGSAVPSAQSARRPSVLAVK